MIKPEFSFFQIVIKFAFWHPIKLGQPSFGKTPKGLNTINMPVTTSKFIVAMLDAIMLVIPNVNQAIIAAPAIAVDTAWQCLFYRV